MTYSSSIFHKNFFFFDFILPLFLLHERQKCGAIVIQKWIYNSLWNRRALFKLNKNQSMFIIYHKNWKFLNNKVILHKITNWKHFFINRNNYFWYFESRKQKSFGVILYVHVAFSFKEIWKNLSIHKNTWQFDS